MGMTAPETESTDDDTELPTPVVAFDTTPVPVAVKRFVMNAVEKDLDRLQSNCVWEAVALSDV